MKYFFLFSLLVLPVVIFMVDNRKMVAYGAEEDPIDEDEADVEGEENDVTATEESEEEEEEALSKASPDADTILLFVKPALPQGASQLELTAGTPVEFLVGFRNKGQQEFVVDAIDASFRYPMDFNFFIQNFSAIPYNKIVKPEQEATFFYSFMPSETFAGRPFGLNINLNYHDVSGNAFQEAVYNETVQIVELDEGFDGETFFLYIFLAAGVVLLLVIGQQTLLSVGKKRPAAKKSAPVETGTNNPNNVDYDWLPAQTLASLNKEKGQKSPKASKQQQSPRQRKVKRSTGSE
ncbi:LOW QUALITY PROTEIN: translocon-associated protein subunit alpha [Anthonomus grandis grandis]|uniref:LOW QUALITY PROTEIN: translocon-associated protein subunit alpha n=1 Tax=Anthonomus grandis grandis TaxID=2921223 RepID=UPI0021655D49|nr:LOW QUALITY PROTEIN: translocon-associated protein subunit alpha [Anthonomus grandis grandis]